MDDKCEHGCSGFCMLCCREGEGKGPCKVEQSSKCPGCGEEIDGPGHEDCKSEFED